jgi:pyruvate,water dikinase
LCFHIVCKGASFWEVAIIPTRRDQLADDIGAFRRALIPEVHLAEARAKLAGTDLRDLVRQRREEYERELRRRHLPRLLLSDGTEPEAVARAGAPATGALTGTPASAGSVTGVARVILDPVGAHLAPGEILVAPSTDPGWTPLFLTASGLVMEMGGANSHGAVVAREYGIPAVVGVADAVSRINTGDRITVDGSAGTITTGHDA